MLQQMLRQKQQLRSRGTQPLPLPNKKREGWRDRIRQRAKVVLLSAVTLLLTLPTPTAAISEEATASSDALIHAKIREHISLAYPALCLVTIDDLEPTTQTYFSEANKGEHPGIACFQDEESTRVVCAVLVAKKSSKSKGASHIILVDDPLGIPESRIIEDITRHGANSFNDHVFLIAKGKQQIPDRDTGQEHSMTNNGVEVIFFESHSYVIYRSNHQRIKIHTSD